MGFQSLWPRMMLSQKFTRQSHETKGCIRDATWERAIGFDQNKRLWSDQPSVRKYLNLNSFLKKFLTWIKKLRPQISYYPSRSRGLWSPFSRLWFIHGGLSFFNSYRSSRTGDENIINQLLLRNDIL